MERPTSITVIAWVFIGFGILALLTGLFGLAISFVSPTPSPTPQEAAHMPAPFQLMSSMFNFFWLIAGLQLASGALMIWAGVAFLKLRSWARAVLEVFSWLALAYNLCFGVFWVWSLASMTRQVPHEAGPAAAIPYIMMIFGIIITIAFSLPVVV